MLGQYGRSVPERVFAPVVKLALRHRISPNTITVTGTILSVTAAVTLLTPGFFIAGPLLLAVLLFADSLDGLVARAGRGPTQFGAFLDSTLDRLADGAVFGALTVWAANNTGATLRAWLITAGMALVICAATVPYARARAEAVGVNAAKRGYAERTDRLLIVLSATLLVGFGAPVWVLALAMTIGAVASFATIVQRILIVNHALKGR